MIWGVGTGRCGTKSLADQMGGLHEPEPNIKNGALECAHTGGISEELKKALRARAKLDTPIIVDNKQSLVIHVIRDIDPDASFIWLLRHPMDTALSFQKRGQWNQIARYTPCYDGWDELSHFRKCAVYWLYKNRLIEKALRGLPYVVMFTNSLKVKANKSMGKKPIVSPKDQKWFEEYILPQWNIWKEIYIEEKV